MFLFLFVTSNCEYICDILVVKAFCILNLTMTPNIFPYKLIIIYNNLSFINTRMSVL